MVARVHPHSNCWFDLFVIGVRMRALLLGVALLYAPVLLPAQQQQSYDLLIRNGRIIDGTGSPWYAGDVGIREGKIAAIGRLGDAAAKRTIDAAGKVVAPGFIDMLG